MRYEIDAENCLWIYESEGAEVAFIKQPHWPDSTPWGEGEAEAWAEQFIANRQDPTQDRPGNNPAKPTSPPADPLDTPVGDLTQRKLDEIIANAVAQALGK